MWALHAVSPELNRFYTADPYVDRQPWALGLYCKCASLSEPSNHQLVPVRPIEAKHVHNRSAFGRINKLPDAQQRVAPQHAQQISSSRIGRRSIHFFVGVTKLDLVLSFKDFEK